MIGDNIRKARRQKDISQLVLAKKLKVAQSTVGMWEANRRTPDVEMLKEIARVLDTTLAFLAGEIPPKTEEPHYLYDEAREVAEAMHKNPNIRALFDASRKVSTEDLKMVLKIIEKFKEEEDG